MPRRTWQRFLRNTGGDTGLRSPCVGWRRWSLSKKSHVGSTASAAISNALPVLLVSSRGMITGVPLFVWYDGTLTSKRPVLAAAELARIASQKLTVLLPSLEPESDDHLQEQVMGLLREKGIRLKWQRVSCSDQASLSKVLRSEPVSLIILTGPSLFEKGSLCKTLSYAISSRSSHLTTRAPPTFAQAGTNDWIPRKSASDRRVRVPSQPQLPCAFRRACARPHDYGRRLPTCCRSPGALWPAGNDP